MVEQAAAARLHLFLNRRLILAPWFFVAKTADVIGAVSVGEYSSIWFQTVIRGDINEIQIGRRTNIQDGSVLHVADDYPVWIGDDVTCGQAVIHACRIN